MSAPPQTASFDHLVGAGEHRWRYIQAERAGFLQIDRQSIFRRLLERQFSGVFAAQDTVDIAGGSAINVLPVNSVESQAAMLEVSQIRVNRRQTALPNQFDDLRSHCLHGDVRQKIDCRVGLRRERGKRAIDIGEAVNGKGNGFDFERTCECYDLALEHQSVRIVRIEDQPNAGGRRRNLFQQVEQLAEDREL